MQLANSSRTFFAWRTVIAIAAVWAIVAPCLAQQAHQEAGQQAPTTAQGQTSEPQWLPVRELAKLLDPGKLAVKAAKAMLTMEMKTSAEPAPKVALHMASLATLMEIRDEFPAAIRYREWVLQIKEKLYGPTDWRVSEARDAVEDTRRLGNRSAAERGRFRKQFAQLRSLSDKALGFHEQHQYEATAETLEQALAVCDELYPSALYPDGHMETLRVLQNLGGTYVEMDAIDRARNRMERAMDMARRLFPPSRYPQGHPVLGINMSGYAKFLEARGQYLQARGLLVEARDMYFRVYSPAEYPQGHPSHAKSLVDLGLLSRTMGNFGEARGNLEQAVRILQKRYPESKYPNGDPELAQVLNYLGVILSDQGDYGEARECMQKSLEMKQRLYPKSKFPQGHPAISKSLNDLAFVLDAMGEHAEALGYHEKSLSMLRQLYPESRFPQGHRQIITALNNLGSWYDTQERYAEARDYFQQALEMAQQLYPGKPGPDGQTVISIKLHNLGGALTSLGQFEEGRAYSERALEMSERVYPPDQYPLGHPNLALVLGTLGQAFEGEGKLAEARRCFERSLEIRLNFSELFFSIASEAEALNYVDRNPWTRDALLSISRQLNEPAERSYAWVWRSRGMVQRIIGERQQWIARSVGNSDVREMYTTYLQTREALGRLALDPPPADAAGQAAHRDRLVTLSKEKERLERELAAKVPEFRQQMESQRYSPADLLANLPPRSVLVDLLQYHYGEQDRNQPGQKGRSETLSYVAFVSPPGGPVTRVDLGPVGPIDRAVEAWRASIVPLAGGQQDLAEIAGADKQATAAVFESPEQYLSRLVWTPIEKHLPADTQTVFVCPDGRLTALPWAALPRREAGRILLEDYVLAVVPSGQYLVESLRRSPARTGLSPTLLVVGDVNYGERPGQVPPVKDLTFRAAAGGDEQRIWSPLPGARTELAEVVRLAGNQPVRQLTGNDANTASLPACLTEVRYAHLATHGFFAGSQFRSVSQSPDTLRLSELFPRGGQRRSVPSRNPLVLSGLVLAGANVDRPKDQFGIPYGDGGILTAEAIAGLSLHQLELVVLSACETGLGDVAGGEGVFGLQRAFHVAGARNVVASLWKVDDAATQALMVEFYRNLWEKRLPMLEALRQAQLHMVRNYDPKAGSFRGTVARLKPMTRDETRKEDIDNRAGLSPFYWAAFVISGSGVSE